MTLLKSLLLKKHSQQFQSLTSNIVFVDSPYENASGIKNVNQGRPNERTIYVNTSSNLNDATEISPTWRDNMQQSSHYEHPYIDLRYINVVSSEQYT